MKRASTSRPRAAVDRWATSSTGPVVHTPKAMLRSTASNASAAAVSSSVPAHHRICGLGTPDLILGRPGDPSAPARARPGATWSGPCWRQAAPRGRSCRQRNSDDRAAIRRRSWPWAARRPATAPAWDGRLQLFIGFPQLRMGIILRLCYTTIDPPVFAYAGILTPHTGTTGAERNARFVRIADAGGEGSGGSGASSRG